MPGTTNRQTEKLPSGFRALLESMPPRAIRDDGELDRMLEMIDRRMATRKLTKGQELYLETLVQLVEAYEAHRHAIDTSNLTGLDSLQHLVEENGMSASDLARLLGVHVSMGSKILKGQRSLTVSHLRKLADRFRVRPDLFIDG